MKTFNRFTESYEIIRRTLRELFVYGCFDSTVGAARQKISDRKYSDELNRIRYFWSEHVAAERHGGKKINFFPFVRCRNGENYLVRSYQIHTFRPQDLNLYIFLLQILSDGKFYGVTELIDEVLFRVDLNEDTGIFYPMMLRKLDEMTAAGLLVREKNSARYKLSEDIFADFDSAELLRLYRILFLYRELLPPASVGYQLQKILGDYLQHERGEDLPPSCFWLEDIFYQNVLNDEIFYKLLVAFEQRRRVAFLLPNRLVTDAIPQQIIFDCQYGRQYLRGEANGENFFWRLDNISNLRLLEKFDAEKFPDENSCRHVWNASLPKTSESPRRVEIDFVVADDERHLLKRLEAEKRFGEVITLDQNHLLFSVALIDPNELVPWIRSFGHAAHVRPSQKHDLQEKLRREWTEALENYLVPEKTFESVKSFLPTKNFSVNDLPPPDFNPPEIFSEFRNAFYRAVTRAYNEILIDDRHFDEKNLTAYLGENSFGFDENFSLHDSLIREMLSHGEDIKNFSLFRAEDGRLIPTQHGELYEISAPPLRLLAVEKRWLRTFSDAPLVKNLLGKTLFDKLTAALKNVQPFPLKKFFVTNGQRTDGDNFNDPQLAERILLLTEAIEQKIFLRYEQRANNGTIFDGLCLPTKIIYSPYLQKFQVRVAVQNSAERKLINVSNFTRLKRTSTSENFSEEFFAEPEPKNFLKLRIFPIRSFNDVERCFLLFAANRKEGHFDSRHNVYHLKIFYSTFESRALRRKILSLGKAVVVDEPASLRDSFVNELQTLCKNFP